MSANDLNGSASEGSGGRVIAIPRNGYYGTRGSARLGGGLEASNSKSSYWTHEQVHPIEVTPEMLAEERATLLAEKQKGLDHIVDRHDDLVREMFQMEHFINMLLYDPKVAKEDHTAVFREYKSRYDLVDNTAPLVGSSRQTRGRHNERRQVLQNATISAFPADTPIRRKAKSKNADESILQNILASAKAHTGKGKRKAVAPDLPDELAVAPEAVAVESASAPVVEDTIIVRRKPNPPSPPQPRIIRPTINNSLSLPSTAVNRQESISALKPPRRNTNKNTHTPSLERAPPVSLDVLEQIEKTESVVVTNAVNGHSCPPPPAQLLLPEESISTGLARRSGRLREPLTTISAPKTSSKPLIKLKVREHTDVISTSPAPLPPPPDLALNPILSKPSVKRIRLIVRRPPPLLTNPKQRAPPPKFNSSLTRFLTSYIAIDEEQDVKVTTLQQEIRAEAEIRERIERFRREGRFIPGTDVLFGTAPHDIPYTSPQRTTRDIWDDIVQTVIAKGRTRPKRSAGRQITSQIASKIQAHFDGRETRKVKAKEAEEKRLRNLAKSTMKLVIAEWKKALYHIREKQRLEAEAEEQRLGRMHLDAILDQSGQILETQQGDLTRGDLYMSRSRSGSIGDFLDNTDEEEEEDNEGQGEQEHGEGEDGSNEEQEDEDQEDADNQMSMGVRPNDGEGEDEEVEEDEDEMDEIEDSTTFMLLSLPPPKTESQPITRSSTPTTPSPGSPSDEDEDPEFSTTQLLTGGTALNDLLAYEDSSSETDLEDLIHPNPASSPQRPQEHLLYASKLSDTEMVDQDHTVAEYSTSTELVQIQHEVQTLPASASHSPVPSGEAPSSSRHSADMEDYFLPQGISSDVEQQSSQIEIDDSESADVPMEADDEQAEGGASEEDAPEDNVREEDGQQDNAHEEDSHEEDLQEKEAIDPETQIPEYLQPYAVAPVQWDPDSKVTPPLLLRGVLRPYQQSGLEWLASLHVNKLNGILADEMGLGKTIQTIALLAHLACDRGIWGPHLIVVPTSVLLNWEMEFKKFLPGFRVLSYHGSTKRRKELRQGWNDKHHFNVCITSYTLASRDAHIFKRKAWYYMILDEAHMIKNFKSQRWNILLMFRSYRRLLLTGTPLQNNLTELWALLQFLMSGSHFANLKEFGEWFSNPLEKAIEMGSTLDDETMQRVSKLHTVLRPYLLRRLKRDVEKELPSKFEHLTLCPLSKRQRFLYDEFMSRAQTRDALDSGVYQKIANILMQLRKVCNHPDLFEIRPIVTSFAMPRSAIADFEIKELLVRRRMLADEDECVNLDVIGLRFIGRQNVSLLSAVETRRLDSTALLPYFSETAGEPPPKDTRTISGYHKYSSYVQRANAVARWSHMGYLNKLRCSQIPIISEECISVVRRMSTTIIPFSNMHSRHDHMEKVDHINKAVKSYEARAQEMATLVDHFAFITPPVVALDLPRIALRGSEDVIVQQPADFDSALHRARVKMQIAFPDPSLLQYDCGKMQKLASLLRERKAGGHRVLIFTQMTRILDILEIFLNFHGYLYLRLDGATKIEDRQYITERFNADPRIFCFIASSRSGGVGINLTGADTVIFYDSDFNPQMDRQCEDRAHRIGQIRDVHIYRFVSQYTVEEAMLLKANQKRSLDDLVIQKGEFDWRTLFNDESALTKALGDFEDDEDRHAAAVAAREEFSLVGADEADFGDAEGGVGPGARTPADVGNDLGDIDMTMPEEDGGAADDDDEQGGSVVEYMLAFVEVDYDYFKEWRL